MTTIINGSSPSITFSDSTTQTTAFTTGAVTQSTVSTSTVNGFGLCRAWVSFNGSNGSIYASYNVSSVTRNGTGWYTVNFATAFADTYYSTVVAVQPTVSNGGSDTFPVTNITTSVDIRHYEVGTSRDGSYCCVAVFR